MTTEAYCRRSPGSGKPDQGDEGLHRHLIKGCTPPSSTTWKDPDNNVAFHNKTTVMTHNFTISIAAKWLDDSNNAALTPEQRALGKKNYDETIITASFPNKPDGTPIKYRSDVKTGLMFTVAKNKAEGKEFIKFLLQEENVRPYIEGALGRWFPVTTASQQSRSAGDRHRRRCTSVPAATRRSTSQELAVKILNKRTLGQAMNRVVRRGAVDKASTTDRPISRSRLSNDPAAATSSHANAGTLTPRRSLLKDAGRRLVRNNKSRWLWVPAFAGTTT